MPRTKKAPLQENAMEDDDDEAMPPKPQQKKRKRREAKDRTPVMDGQTEEERRILRQEQRNLQDRIGEISRERDQLVAITKQYNRAFSGYRDAVSAVVRLRKRRRRTTRSYWKKTSSL